MSSPHPLTALSRTWWLVPAAVVAALVVSFVLTRNERPTYRAGGSVVVIPNGVAIESVRDQIDALANLDRRNVVATIAGIAHSTDVLTRAAARAGMTPDAARPYRVRATVRPNTNILDIEVLGPDAAACATLAREVAAIASSECTDNYRIYRLRPLDAAVAPSRPDSPDMRRNLIVGGILGLLAGLLLAASSEWARRGLAARAE